MDCKNALAQDLVHFTTLAENNIKQHVNERALKKDITIKPAYVTYEEAEQETSLLILTTNELKIKIFQTMEMLDAETSKMMEEAYNRNVKNRKKKTALNPIINYAMYWMIRKYQLLKIMTILATNINILTKFRTRQKSKMELFAIIVYAFKFLNILAKSSILDVCRVPDSLLYTTLF